MNRLIFFLIFTVISTFVIAQPPAGDASKGDIYGKKISKKGAVDIAEVAERLENEPVVYAKAKATIVDVCANKGCWLNLQVDEHTTAFVKMKDYAFFLPVAAAGKEVVIEGEFSIKTTSVEELQHYAEDAGKSAEEIAAITEPKEEIRVLATGIRVIK